VKVDISTRVVGEPSPGETPSRSRSAAERARTGGTRSDTIQLSSLLNELQGSDGLTAGSNVLDSRNIDQIKLAIAEGRFQVNPEKIADGLMATVVDLLQARKS
jgi:negative regulator of flagellin synthesis FlgM